MEPKEPTSIPPRKSEEPQPQDFTQPVAYDQQGRPLYAHPPSAGQRQEGPQMVYVSRPVDPVRPELPPEVMKRCEESKRKYPHLNLSYGEFIISAVKRHPIGLIQIWFFVLVMIGAFGAIVAMFVLGMGGGESILTSMVDNEEVIQGIGMSLLLVVSVLGVAGGMVASYVYNNNRFYLTNESVIQLIQTTLFSMHEQTVSLANIEDASYEQHGILPHLLNYGRIRLSTEGDETTYRFNYVYSPKQHIAKLNNAVEAFKNGRPVQLDDNNTDEGD